MGHALHFTRRPGVRREPFGPRFSALRAGFGAADVLALAPAAWFRLGVGTTVVTGVSQWSDQSGNGRHLLQATGAAQPALQADGSIIFNGTAHFMKASFTLASPQSVYLLARQVTWTVDDVIFDGSNDVSMMVQQQTAGTTPNITVRNTNGIGSANGGLAVNTYGVISAVFGASAISSQVNLNTPVSNAFAGVAAGGVTLGSRGSGAALFGNIQAKELIVFGAEHAPDVRAKIVRYLAALGGVSV